MICVVRLVMTICLCLMINEFIRSDQMNGGCMGVMGVNYYYHHHWEKSRNLSRSQQRLCPLLERQKREKREGLCEQTSPAALSLVLSENVLTVHAAD